MKTQISHYDVARVVSYCMTETTKLKALVPENPLLSIDIKSVEGRRYIIRRFWPDNEEETQVLLEDSLRNWVNFYTALLCVRLKAIKEE